MMLRRLLERQPLLLGVFEKDNRPRDPLGKPGGFELPVNGEEMG